MHEHMTPAESIESNKSFPENVGRMAGKENHFGKDGKAGTAAMLCRPGEWSQLQKAEPSTEA